MKLGQSEKDWSAYKTLWNTKITCSIRGIFKASTVALILVRINCLKDDFDKLSSFWKLIMCYEYF